MNVVNKKKIEIHELIKEIYKEKKDEWELMIKNINNKIENNDYWEFYTENLNDTSELKMHKILYFLYGFFWAEKDKELFKPEFQSWKHGPVEINYRSNKKMELEFEEKDKEFLKKTLYLLMKYNVWKLVELSHLTDPWEDNGAGIEYHRKIPNDDIQKYFKRINNLK